MYTYRSSREAASLVDRREPQSFYVLRDSLCLWWGRIEHWRGHSGGGPARRVASCQRALEAEPTDKSNVFSVVSTSWMSGGYCRLN
jgi:hypothetical protein